ncbi:MAG: ribonuclease P protein component [Deltaproteobacteria bacterium]|nr:ribonuclease P protein component [Deltaproteobacteria bacterium]
MAPPDQRFPRTARLRRRGEFLRVQRTGKKVHTTHFVLVLWFRGDRDPARLGLVTSRKAAPSVGRAWIRRRVREVFRLHRGAFPTGADVVVIARAGAADLAFGQVRDEILSALSRRRPPPKAP